MHAEGSVARANQINTHIGNIASGSPPRVARGQKGLARMKLSAPEKQHVQRYLGSTFEPSMGAQTSDKLKPIKTGPVPALGYSQKQIAHPNRTIKQLTHLKAENVRNANQLDAIVNPLSHQNLQWAAEQATGYHEIAHIRQHPIAGSVALAGILPFGKAAKLAEVGVDAARGIDTAEHAVKVAQAAEDARGLKKIALQRRAVRLGRRTSPEDAKAILEQQRQNAVAKALKKARKNPTFAEHLPGEIRSETGGAVGLKVREAMKGVKAVYKKQKGLQRIESAKRTAQLSEAQKAAGTFEEAAGAQSKLAGQLPRVPFKGFESLKPHLEEIKNHIDTLNLLPHDRNRLLNAIKAGTEGEVPNPSQRKLIESVFGREVQELSPAALKDRGVGGNLTDILNIPRALESSADLSGAFRQNLAAVAAHPKLVFQGYHQTLHAAVSQGEFDRLMAEDVHGDPYYHMAKADGVQITEMHEGLNQREEAYASNWAEHLHEIPGVKHTPLKYPLHGVSAVVKGSDRNYILLLNRTRMRLYRMMVDQASENGYRMDGLHGEKLRSQIADTVNTLTGRGNWGGFIAAHRATLNALFFSPGLMKSRINLLNPVWYVHAEPFVRQQRLRAGLRLYGTLAGILYAAKMAGAQVGMDPTNADFGKMKIGNTRIDVAGGLTQYMRLIGQLAEGKITSSTTGIAEPLSNGPFKTSYGNVAQQFFRNKLSPIPGLAYSAAFGPGFGQKLNPSSIAGQMFVPLLIQDMYQIQHAKGPGGGPGMAAATFLPDLLGVGVQNYGPRAKAKHAPASRGFGSGGSGTSFGGGSSSSFGG